MITNCQRCDKDLRIPDGENSDRTPQSHDNKLEGSFTFEGAYGSLKYDFERWQAELCESCCAELRDWIDAGPGKGVFKFDWHEVDRKARNKVFREVKREEAKGKEVSKEEVHNRIFDECQKIIAPKVEAFLLETKETSRKGELR